MLKHVSAPIPDLLAECPECSGAVAAVVRKMMAKAPAERHQSYEELATDLQSAYGSLTTPAPATPTPMALTGGAEGPGNRRADAPTTIPNKKRRLILLLAGVCAIGVAVAVGLLRSKLASAFAKRPKTIDLLALADPVRDRVAPANMGKNNLWEKSGAVLRYVSDAKAGLIMPPAVLNASEYILEIHFKRLGGNGQMHANIPIPGKKHVPLILDKTGEKILSHKGLPAWPADLPPEGKIIIHVKLGDEEEPDTVAFELNGGNLLPPWRGRLKDLSRPQESHSDFPDRPMTSLFSMRDAYEFSRWTVTPIKGSVDVLR